MSNKRNLQQGHFIGTTSSISIVTPTFATSFAVKSHKNSYDCRIDKVTSICFPLFLSRAEASLSFSSIEQLAFPQADTAVIQKLDREIITVYFYNLYRCNMGAVFNNKRFI